MVLSGRVGLVEHDADGDRVIQVHGPGSVLGELGMLGQPAPFSARVERGGEILAIPADHLSNVTSRDSVLGETILRAYLIRRSRLIARGAGMRIIGSCYDPDTRRLLDFATRNRLPHKWIDLEKDTDAEAFLRRMNVDPSDTPVVILGRGKMLRNPSNSQIAAELGQQASPGRARVRDLLVVGAGPAGLAASVYSASDGLQVTTVDAIAAGGQASTTSRIENYQAHVASMPGTTWPVNGHPPGSSRDYPPAPVLMPTNLFRHVNSYNARLPDPRLTRETGPFPTSLTTTVSN